MQFKTGETWAGSFPVRGTSGLSDADSLPTGTLVLNGVDNGASVTITHKATGDYKFSVTMPTLADGDLVQMRINATVGGTADASYVANSQGVTARVARDTSGRVDIGKLLGTAWLTPGTAGTPDVNAKQIGGTPQTGLDLAANWTAARAAHLDADISSRMATYTQPSGFLAATFPSTVAGTTNITAASGVTLSNAGIDALFTRQLTESYAADGTAPTMAQAIFLVMQTLTEGAISGTTWTIKKLDGSTTAAVITLDSATAPTTKTRSS